MRSTATRNQSVLSGRAWMRLAIACAAPPRTVFRPTVTRSGRLFVEMPSISGSELTSFGSGSSVAYQATNAHGDSGNPDSEVEVISRKSLPDLVTVGLNTVRGGAAHAMANLIHARPDRTDWFRVAVERMVHDPSTAVRAMVASVLIAVLRHDRSYAVRQFLRLCDADDELLGAGDVEEFMHYSLRPHFSTLEPILQRMLMAHEKTTSVAGARQSCLA